ncbi:hypothetical protein C5B85_08805 [Pseudoclavibacter sp. AY1F1]|uniref:hypothetical protein n=1 Tax=Pseudoclavibacter sp. AY1F1 TaxID=2080583 RepID=UPI000CE9273F|nr:hypothetical protein [Pseudoclavibacter sp. AY1F1]PPF44831.1 hypothetical protein C5B85_08805 [Pseudoclavibacter sp. AY1F1]
MRFDNDEARLNAVRGIAYLLEDRDRWAEFLTAVAQEAPALWGFLEFATEAYDRFWESFNSADEFVPEQIVAELQAVLTHMTSPERSEQ